MNAGSSARGSDLLERILPQLRVVKGPDKHGRYICWCPFHPDGQGDPPHRPNLSVSSLGYVCHACGAKGNLGHLAEELGLDLRPLRDRPEFAFDYRDENGLLLFQVCRLPGKRFYQRRPDGSGGWIRNLNGVRRVLYRLPQLLASREEPVYIVEGEKDADRLAEGNLTATTNPGGASKWRKEYGQPLRGREVIILPDNDEPGRRHALEVACQLDGIARSITIIELQDLPDKGDVSDWLSSGHTIQDLEALAECSPVWEPSDCDLVEGSRAGGVTKNSQASRLVALAEERGVKLFLDQYGCAFARLPVGDHQETWSCDSGEFREWLASALWESEGEGGNPGSLRSAITVIKAKAKFEGGRYALHNRVARHDNAFWLDLADREWRAVRVTASGWHIVSDPPILFRRYTHQRALPDPMRGGDLHDLLSFVNLTNPSDELLLIVYIVSCFVPSISHPIPVVYGPQGSAKTTLLRMLRRLIDPSAVEVLSLPDREEELTQQLSHHWAPYYDNISSVPARLSDSLCRAVTGQGFSKRRLYTNDGDVIYDFRRCVGINGINVPAGKPDLLDRCLLFGLRSIDPERRRSEEAVEDAFEAVRPLLLGGILDALSRAMGLRETVSLTRLPRMADFALWGCAIAPALGHTGQEFLSAYEMNTQVRNEEALLASPVAVMVAELMEHRTDWEGTPTGLLEELEALAKRNSINTRAADWPRAPHALTRRLNEVGPALAAVGVEIVKRRDGKRRGLLIVKTREMRHPA